MTDEGSALTIIIGRNILDQVRVGCVVPLTRKGVEGCTQPHVVDAWADLNCPSFCILRPVDLQVLTLNQLIEASAQNRR